MPAVERRTGPVELLWDLVFVFAVTRVTTLLAADLSWAGFGRSLLVLALVWWAWSAFVWATNAEDPDALRLRALLFVGMVLIFVAGLALPQAFGADATLFTVSYALVRLLHLALYADVSRRGNASLPAIAGFALTTVGGMALLVAGSFLDEPWRVVLWLAAAALDYAGPAWLTRERLRGLQEVVVSHFAERYGLFVIICLGESVISIGAGASGRPLDAALIAAACLSLLLTIGLWWIYFDRTAGRAEERLRRHHDPVLAAADAYSYLHLLIVGGIIVFAVGARETVAHTTEPLASGERLALCGGVALYLVGHAAFRLRMVGAFRWGRPAAAALALVLFAVSGSLDAWLVALVLTALVGTLAVAEWVAEREPGGGPR
ncbi:MAG TPA: low temperature requirement protein A [Gaiellaceae bacterium]|jgi:low temperature requirement protein LtrA|nr:low temperature requirement protein A [Gaiellaceae bacterium]HVV58369.1 low temperature requirement protein A [Gaiellaceae bacterium]